MEIEVSTEKLAKALNNVSRITTSKATLPILNNVLIKVKDKKVSLITTNLDMAVIDYLPVSSSKDGTITTPARLLTDFISTLPKSENTKLTSKDNKLNIISGKYSSTINGTPADDFPELPEIDEKTAVVFKMSTEEFKNDISQIIVAASNDFNRPALTGVHFYTSDKNLYIVATDGYRVAKKKIIKNVKSEVKITVPAASLQETLHAINDEMEEIEIAFTEDLIRFRLGEIEIISKIIDSEYPNPNNLIPKSSKISFTSDREELIRVVKLAALFARHATNDVITLETKTPNIFSVHCIANEYGENDSSIETDINEDGKISVTSRYLLDALNVISTEMVSISFNNTKDSTTPIEAALVLKEQGVSDYIHIIIPMDS